MSTAVPIFSTPADVRNYEQQHPIDSLNLPDSTFDIIQRAATVFGDRPALTFLMEGRADEAGRSYNYREFLGKIIQTANGFEALGLGTQDVVSMLLPNLPQNHFTLWGGEAAGVVNPINPMLEPDHIAGILQAAQTKLLVALAPFPGTDIWDKVEAVKPLVPCLEKVLYVDLCQFLPIDQAATIRAATPLPAHEWAVDFDQWISKQPADQQRSRRIINAQDTASLFHTGGTTGMPKLAPHTHFNEVINSQVIGSWIGLDENDTMLCGLPTFHVNGAVVTGTAAFLFGAHILLATPQGYRNATLIANFWKLVEHHRITFFSAVPAVYAGLLQVPMGDADVSSIKAALCGGASLPVEVHRQFEALAGCALLEAYGLTEGTCGSMANPLHGERRTGSIGICTPYSEGKIVQLDEGGNYLRDCEIGESGTLVLRGPNVFNGYTDPEENTDIWVDGNWFNTGDLARQDKDGYFWITGRSKDLIIRGGHNIDPSIIEEVLNSHPDVIIAAAVGKPCPRVGELPVAFVTLVNGSQTTEQALLELCQQQISERAAIPKTIEILDEMPLTAVGKTFKPALRIEATRGVLEQELLTRLPADHFKLSVEPCSKRGLVANITLNEHATSAREAVRLLLGNYAIHVEITSQ